MAWKGFIRESKVYMNYPKCGRIYFWLRLPAAYWEFRKAMKGGK